jgi:hypothetical protein
MRYSTQTNNMARYFGFICSECIDQRGHMTEQQIDEQRRLVYYRAVRYYMTATRLGLPTTIYYDLYAIARELGLPIGNLFTGVGFAWEKQKDISPVTIDMDSDDESDDEDGGKPLYHWDRDQVRKKTLESRIAVLESTGASEAVLSYFANMSFKMDMTNTEFQELLDDLSQPLTHAAGALGLLLNREDRGALDNFLKTIKELTQYVPAVKVSIAMITMSVTIYAIRQLCLLVRDVKQTADALTHLSGEDAETIDDLPRVFQMISDGYARAISKIRGVSHDAFVFIGSFAGIAVLAAKLGRGVDGFTKLKTAIMDWCESVLGWVFGQPIRLTRTAPMRPAT